MKKILKCLSLLLLIPIISVFALTGCKDKNNNDNNPKSMTYGDLKTVLNSAFTQLYGNDIPAIPTEEPETPEEPGDDEPAGEIGEDAATPVGYGAYAASNNSFTISNGNSVYDEIAKQADAFKLGEGSYVLSINNVSFNILQLAKTPLTIARSLIYQDEKSVLNNAIIFSYREAEELTPQDIDFKIRLTVYKSSVLIECHAKSGGDDYESYFLNIEYNSNYKATKIMYCLGVGLDAEASPLADEGNKDEGKGEEKPIPPEEEIPTEMFLFAIYDIENNTSCTLNRDAENFAEYKAQLKTSMHTFRQLEGTANTSVNFEGIYKLIDLITVE